MSEVVNNGPDGPETRLLLYPINGHRQTAPACLKGAMPEVAGLRRIKLSTGNGVSACTDR